MQTDESIFKDKKKNNIFINKYLHFILTIIFLKL